MKTRTRLVVLLAALGVATAGPAAEGHAFAPVKMTAVAGIPDLDVGSWAGDGGLATSARINRPGDVLATADGGLLIADTNNHRIRRVWPDGTITTVAGKTPSNDESGGFSGDGGPATEAELSHPEALAPLPDGGFAFSDAHNYRIRRVWPDGHITTMAGNGDTQSTGSGDTASTVGLQYVTGLDALADGTLLIAEADPESIVVVAPNGAVSRPGVAGRNVAVDGNGGYFVAFAGARQVNHVTASGDVTIVAGNGAAAPEAELNGEDANDVGIGELLGLTATPDGGVEFWSWQNDSSFGGQLLRVLPDGTIRTVLRRRTVASGLSRAPAGLLIADRVYSAIFLLHKTFLQSGPPAEPGPTQGTNASPSFTFSSPEPGAGFECRLDDGDWEHCDAPTKQYSNVPDGDRTFRVRATDAGGVTDPTPETWSWRTDAGPPEPFALAGPDAGATTGPRPTLSWNPTTDAWSAVAAYEVHLDGTEVADVAPADCEATCSWTAPTLADGAHDWRIVAVDAPGNERQSAERSFTVSAVPTASFTVTPALALTGDTVGFDASASSVENGEIARYEWDLDGNGSFETDSGSSPTVGRSYSAVGTLRPALRVRAAGGAADEADRPLEIRRAPPPGPVGASINAGDQFTNDPDVEVTIRWPAFAIDITLSNDGGFASASVFAVAPTVPWTLRSSGSERLPKTIYARFDGSTQTFQDDIILDQTAPSVRAARRVSARVLKLRATDNVSGVRQLQVARDRDHPGRWRRYRTRVVVKTPRALWVRVRDAAGNESRWKRARRSKRGG
ncbi:MAG TPA: PKD domain-containing protein [Thermoleophilaceae bacterium]